MTSNKEIHGLKTLFMQVFNKEPQITKLTGGGSSRKYFRLRSEEKGVIGVVGDDVAENESFIRLERVLETAGIRVPHVISVSEDKKIYLLEDLGDESLFNLLDSFQKMELSKRALKELIKIQLLPPRIWEEKVGYKPFSERLVRWDLNYFKYDFLKPIGMGFDEEKLEDDFDSLVADLTSTYVDSGLMYRDFQSRNIMLKDDNLWFIDFQGARRGPLAYDAVSFIWQAKAPFSYEERKELGNYYAQELSSYGYDKRSIEAQLYLMQIFRTLQVLGAYGFRGLIEKKAHFIESIPYAISNLSYLKEKGRLKDYPEIEKVAGKLILKNFFPQKEEEGRLTLKVFSFSYKKGYPEDKSGNGGGFMFDCRAIHNPGRYEKYKQLNGKNKEVIEFLERSDEAKDFVKRALDIVSPSIERYLKRGFTSLQVGFGCTGGKHRSVYCAEKFAEVIGQLYPEVKIEIIHKEQNGW